MNQKPALAVVKDDYAPGPSSAMDAKDAAQYVIQKWGARSCSDRTIHRWTRDGYNGVKLGFIDTPFGHRFLASDIDAFFCALGRNR